MKRRGVLFGVAAALGLAAVESVEAANPWPTGPKKKKVASVPTLHPILLARDFTPLTVENTTAETTLFSFTAQAGSLGSHRSLRMRLSGDVLNDSGGNLNLIYRIKYGATTLWQDTHTLFDTPTRKPFSFDILLNANEATNAQILTGTVILTGSSVAPAVGEGSIGGATSLALLGVSAEDSATELAFAVTVDMDVAHADAEVVRRTALVHLE